MNENVILVDEHDNQVGICEKLTSHIHGLRHRAFSVILTQENHILLQRRSLSKYHSGGLWANTACGHPRPNESTLVAAQRRLEEEMGIKCRLTWRSTTHYKARVGTGMTENEIVHLYFAEYTGPVHPNPEEACDWKWYDREVLRDEIVASEQYTYWLREYYRQRLI